MVGITLCRTLASNSVYTQVTKEKLLQEDTSLYTQYIGANHEDLLIATLGACKMSGTIG
jgi:hypothetical protein